ncbi:MAG: GNAT family N-acetyltransferase [Ilumatobacteraceae bacterium]
MRIRELTTTDLPAIFAINDANTPAVGEETESTLGEILDLCSIALGVEVDGAGGPELAGFCQVLPPGTTYGSPNYAWFCQRYASFAYLDRVAFAPAHQGQGYGSALYAEVEQRAAGTSEWFLLEVNLKPRNDGSLRFHARLGFEEVGQQAARGKVVSMMAKRLGS